MRGAFFVVVIVLFVACGQGSSEPVEQVAGPPATGAASASTPAATDSPAPTKPPGAPPTDGTLCTVSNVVDGDTIDVAGCADEGRVRLILVDTPEVFGGEECGGAEASTYTRQALESRAVLLERDVSQTDAFGRYLRYVWIDGELFNERIVRDGMAQLATYPPDVKYVDRIRGAQQEAREHGRGLWAACAGPATATVAPAGPTVVPADCSPAYPDVCIPAPPPDLDCGDIPFRRFAVRPPDPHRFDLDFDGIGCESG